MASLYICVLLFYLVSGAGLAGTTHVAVASNFTRTLEPVVINFRAETGHEVLVSAASTGALYAQIVNGAPFDVFLAADVERPRLLEAAELSVPGTRFSYAVGRLLLWSRDPSLSRRTCRAQLERAAFTRLAIANPETAPYGAAAREYLAGLEVWPQIETKLVFGGNIAQAMQFAASGNAMLGLVAAAQATDSRLPPATCAWLVPASRHAAIEQQAVLLSRASANPAAHSFIQYLQSAAAQGVIEQAGYDVIHP